MGKRVVTFGEIMLRLAPQGFLRFSQADNFDVVYGGGESNVAVSLANYGIPVDFVTRLPKNDIGECAMMEMRKRGVGVDNIVYGGDRLGIYFLETGAVSRGRVHVLVLGNSTISKSRYVVLLLSVVCVYHFGDYRQMPNSVPTRSIRSRSTTSQRSSTAFLAGIKNSNFRFLRNEQKHRTRKNSSVS